MYLPIHFDADVAVLAGCIMLMVCFEVEANELLYCKAGLVLLLQVNQP